MTGYHRFLANRVQDPWMSPGNALLAYIPSRLLELLKLEPAPHPAPPWEERFSGTAMFVDVSGFTPLTETLTRQGAAGTERLTDILNRFYQWLVAAVETAGGFVARFSGDAITAIFPAHKPETGCHEAVHCGLELIQTAWRNPPETVDGQDFPLRIRVGVCPGPIYAAAVGDREGELRYLVAGEAIQGATLASVHCGPMELLIPARWRHALPPDVTTLEAPAGHLTVMPSLLRRAPRPARSLTVESPSLMAGVLPRERLARFVPAVIAERLELGLSELVAEHRPVTVLFARFEGVDFDHPSSSQLIQRFMCEVFERVEVHGGTVDKIEQSDKGNLIMALFGAPRGLERPEEAALDCALELRERFCVSGTGPRVTRIGINTGLVYAGDVGAPWRRDYTVMGDVVNIASRLTSQAQPGEILVSQRVRNREPEWQYGPSRMQHFKGRAEPIATWPLEGRPGADELDQEVIELPDRGDPLIDRLLERQQLDEAIAGLRAGRPAVVVIEGEVGVGKSRLAGYVAEQVFTFGRVVNQRHRQTGTVPYDLWHWPLLDLLGGPGPTLDERVREALRAFDATAEPWLALLNPLLGTGFPASPMLEAVEPRARERRLVDMVVSLLLGFAARTPLLLVLEDFHEADAASASLLRDLTGRLDGVPLLVLIIARPGAPIPPPVPGLDYITLSLTPLDRASLVAFVRALAGQEVSEAVLEAIWERSQGNPLFAEELLHTLQQTGTVRDGRLELGSPDSLRLPDSLRAVLQSRLDELPETCRAVAKVAAVIGTRFTLSTLTAGFYEGVEADFLKAQLEVLIEARLIAPGGGPEGLDPDYEFRHVLSREVVYSAMTQVQQAELHRRIGLWLEQHREGISPGVLAWHFDRGNDHQRAMKYHLEAAAQAFNAFANQEALASYERVVALTDEQWVPLPDGVTRAEVLEAQGDVYSRIGFYRKAEGLFRKVRGIAPDWISVVRTLRKEGEARCRADDVPNALRCYDEALLLLNAEKGWSLFGVALPLAWRLMRDTLVGPSRRSGEPLHPSELPRYVEMDQVYSQLAVALYYEGSHQIVEVIHRMVEVALRLGEPSRIARAYASISFLYATLAMFDLARRFADAALEWLERETDAVAKVRLRATITYVLTGAAARLECDWARAEALQLKGVGVNREVGDVWEEGLGLMNLAIMWRVRGHHEKAIALHDQILKLTGSPDPYLYLGEALVCDGLCLAELGRFDEAAARIERALAHPGLNLLVRVRALAHRGWLKYLQGRPHAGLTDLNEAVRLIRLRRMGGEHVAEILLWWCEVLIASGASRMTVWQAMARAARSASRLPALKGSLAFVRGMAAARQGRNRRARALFAKAVALHKAADRGREAARALVWQASVQEKRRGVLRSEAAKLLRDRGLPEHVPGAPWTPAGLLEAGTRGEPPALTGGRDVTRRSGPKGD